MIGKNWEHKANGLEALTGKRQPFALKTAQQTPAEWQAEQVALADEYRAALLAHKLDKLQAAVERAAKALGVVLQ